MYQKFIFQFWIYFGIYEFGVQFLTEQNVLRTPYQNLREFAVIL